MKNYRFSCKRLATKTCKKDHDSWYKTIENKEFKILNDSAVLSYLTKIIQNTKEFKILNDGVLLSYLTKK